KRHAKSRDAGQHGCGRRQRFSEFSKSGRGFGMSSVTVGSHAHDMPHDAGHAHTASFLSKYVFSKDHKIIGIQFLFSTLLWFLIGGLLALAGRWQIAWPWTKVPILSHLYTGEGGQMSPEAYTMLFTMHATVMIFLVII